MSIQEIYNKVYSEFPGKTSKEIIQVIEPHLEQIMDYDLSAFPENHDGVMRLISDYGIHHSRLKHSNLSIPYLNRGIKMFENTNNFSSAEYYHELRFQRGISYYTIKKFASAEKDFNWLVEHDNANDVYKNWQKASKRYFLERIQYYTTIAIVLFVTLSVLENSNEGILHTITLIGLLSSLITSFGISIYLKVSKLK